MTRLPFSGAHWVDQVARHAYVQPDATALRFNGATITWARFEDRILRLAAALEQRGVGEGDRVAILMTNRPEFLEAVIAINALRAIAVPINFRLTGPEIDYILDDSGAKLLIAEPGLSADAITTGDVYEALLAASDPRPRAELLDENEVALIMYTSGTTGRPKGAMLTHLNLLMQTLTHIRLSRLFHTDAVTLINTPLFHIAGFTKVPPCLLLGTPTVIMPSSTFTAESTLDIVESEGITELFLVPAQWQVLCDHPDTKRRARSLQMILWGASPATVSLLEQMHETFPQAQIVSRFGQTEMSPVTTALPGEDAIRKIGSVGRAVPTVAVRIVDEEMNDVPRGEVGEIVYRGPTTMVGYWNDPEGTAEAFRGGWFHSGDLVYEDDEGFIYVVDRKKDMIISGGENIYCAEVENVLAGHPAVADVAIIGAPHERWGETPVAVIVPVDRDAPPTLEDLHEFTRERLASYKKPTSVLVVDALPRNASGKVRKDELRALV